MPEPSSQTDEQELIDSFTNSYEFQGLYGGKNVDHETAVRYAEEHVKYCDMCQYELHQKTEARKGARS